MSHPSNQLTLWKFIGREVAIGALQAIGAIFLYALAIWAVVNQLIKTKSIQSAINAKVQVIDSARPDSTKAQLVGQPQRSTTDDWS